MLKSERSAFILRYIEQHGSAHIRDLAEALQVSHMSIRRDLMELEATGHIRRVRGGAVIGKSSPKGQTIPAYVRRIAETAAHLLPQEGTFFIGAGLITLELVAFLAQAPALTIITNGLDIAWQVAQHPRHTLHVIGGAVEEGFTIHGDARRLPALTIDWAILEGSGLDAARGLTHENRGMAALLRAVIKNSTQKMVVIPPDSLGHAAGEFIAPVDMLDVLITGREASTAALWDLSEAGLRFVLA